MASTIKMTWQMLDIETMTNLYLYGDFNKPSNLVDEKLIRNSTDQLGRDQNGNKLYYTTVEITNINDFMQNGPGRIATPNQFSIIKNFMQGGMYTLQPGQEYQLEIINTQAGEKYPTNRIFSTQEFYYIDNMNDHELRTYVYGSVSFVIKSGTLVVNADGSREIKNLVIAPIEDNFDYTSGNPLVQMADSYFLQNNTDPSNIGRTVKISYKDNLSSIQAITYTATMFTHDENADIYHPIDGLAGAINYTLNVPNELWNSGITKFIDPQGRAIYYGTNGDDPIIASNIGSKLTDYRLANQVGTVQIAGKGNDTLRGNDYGLVLLENKSDYLLGGTGYDKYIAG
ncbi:MAG: hypothetical protein PHX59_07585, partial [Sulfuricurvum sp.]|nr:hypothetical protein [Sulfuricurvum sp.]